LHSGENNFYSYVDDPNGWIDVFGLANNSYGKSSKKYGHARNRHGSQKSEQSLRDKGRSKNKDQGHFQDNKMIEESFSLAPDTVGVHDVEVSVPGNVYHVDGGTTTTNTVRVVIGEDGPITAYPYAGN